jgi:hypothetical protein
MAEVEYAECSKSFIITAPCVIIVASMVTAHQTRKDPRICSGGSSKEPDQVSVE